MGKLKQKASSPEIAAKGHHSKIVWHQVGYGIACAFALLCAIVARQYMVSTESGGGSGQLAEDRLAEDKGASADELLSKLLEAASVWESTPSDSPEKSKRRAEIQELLDVLSSDTAIMENAQAQALIEVLSGIGSDSSDVSSDAEEKADAILAEYWKGEFAKENGTYGEKFEWLLSWHEKTPEGFSLRDVIKPQLLESDSILVLGCGNSALPWDLYQDGFEHLTSIDLAETVIEKARKAFASTMPKAVWKAMDAQSLAFDDAAFDAVIDKSTLDAIFGGSTALQNRVLTEVFRVLRPGGRLISITYSGKRIESLRVAGSEAHPNFECEQKGPLTPPKQGEGEAVTDKVFVVICRRGIDAAGTDSL